MCDPPGVHTLPGGYARWPSTRDAGKPETKANFGGVAIGNGFLAPINQYAVYANFVYAKKLIIKPTEIFMLVALPF